jgi:hypothetical protein
VDGVAVVPPAHAVACAGLRITLILMTLNATINDGYSSRNALDQVTFDLMVAHRFGHHLS